MTMPVAVCALIWWWQHDDAVATVPAPPPVFADSAIPHDVCSASTSAPVVAATPAPAPALKLNGTVMAGTASFAMVRRATDSRLLQLRMGDRVDGFVVTAIESDRIVLAGAGRSIAIEAEAPPAAVAVAPVVAAPAAPAVAHMPAPHLIPIEQLPAAYRGPAPEDEVLGH